MSFLCRGLANLSYKENKLCHSKIFLLGEYLFSLRLVSSWLHSFRCLSQTQSAGNRFYLPGFNSTFIHLIIYPLFFSGGVGAEGWRPSANIDWYCSRYMLILPTLLCLEPLWYWSHDGQRGHVRLFVKSVEKRVTVISFVSTLFLALLDLFIH